MGRAPLATNEKSPPRAAVWPWHVRRTPPAPFHPDRAPPVEAVRPHRCPACGASSGVLGAPTLWGHGVRHRDVVVPGPRPTLKTVWVRRFLCRRCGATCSVSPPGVLPRHLYALAAIVSAWWLAAPRPIGDGLHDEAVYAHVGVDRRADGGERGRAGRRRWRSLARWTRSMDRWWPTRPVRGATWRQRAGSLVVGFLHGDGGRDAAIRRAVLAHTAGGAAM